MLSPVSVVPGFGCLKSEEGVAAPVSPATAQLHIFRTAEPPQCFLRDQPRPIKTSNPIPESQMAPGSGVACGAVTWPKEPLKDPVPVALSNSETLPSPHVNVAEQTDIWS